MKNTNDYIIAELKESAELRKYHLQDALESMVNGDPETALLMIRNVVNATGGFIGLGKAIDKDPKTVMKMLSASGNPSAKSLFSIISFLLSKENLKMKMDVVRDTKRNTGRQIEQKATARRTEKHSETAQCA